MYIEKKKSIKIYEIFFKVAYYPWIVSWIITITYFKDYLHPYAVIRIWNVFGAILLICNLTFVDSKYKKNRVILSFFFLILGLVVTIGNGNASFVFYTALLIVSAQKMNIYSIIKNTMYIQMIICLATICCSLVGFLPNESIISYIGGLRRERHYLGCVYISTTSNLMASITIEYLFLNLKKKNRIFNVILLIFLNWYIYHFTSTRMPFYISVLSIALLFIIKLLEPKSIGKIFKVLINGAYIIAAMVSILLSLFYSPNIAWMRYLNMLLSQRIRYGQLGFVNWGVSLFGTPITWNATASNYNYIDSSYVNILLSYGIILFLFIIGLLTYTCIKATKENNIAMCTILVLWAIRAMVDPQLFNIWFNPFLLYIGSGVECYVNSK